MASLVLYFLSIFLLVAFIPRDSSAAIYKWIDPSGTIHFSDNFDDIPPAYRSNFKIITEPRGIEREMIIPFEKTAAGLILVEVILNDHVKARMVLDTGANLVVITQELSKKLNQDLASQDQVVKLQTNWGEVEGRTLVIDKIELGEARKKNVRSVVTPSNPAFIGFDGLLGLSFLGDFKVTVDYKNGKIILGQ